MCFRVRRCFNPRVLAGGRDITQRQRLIIYKVSIHASSREDATSLSLIPFRASSFNPRVLAGGRDDGNRAYITSQIRFNPRVLAGGRDKLAVMVLVMTLFQSTRPRGRTRPGKIVPWIKPLVSIHASSREDATCRHEHHARKVSVSIHASSREDATPGPGRIHTARCFNPRVLAGGRDLT